MKISVIIPFKNDWDELDKVLAHILATSTEDNEQLEIIVVNDGSFNGDGSFCPITGIDHPSVVVLNNRISMGVGASFDRGVEVARGDIIILQGCDVFPMGDWYNQVIDAVQSNPNTLGCSVCVGINPKRTDPYDPKNFKRYGADLLFYVDTDDLPKDSAFRNRKGGYTSLFKAKWLPGKQSDEPYSIPCLLGAFYFCTKEYYTKIGGWDTEKNNRYRGHQCWGHLEAHISLKSWLAGGGCTLYPKIESAHVFARTTDEVMVGKRHPRLKRTQKLKGNRGEEWQWWNAIFILETMIFDAQLRQKLYNFIHPELNWNVARKMIKDHYGEVEKVREANRLKFKYDHTIFTDKFGYSFDIN